MRSGWRTKMELYGNRRDSKSHFFAEKTKLYIVDLEMEQLAYIKENEKIICRLTRLIEIKPIEKKPKNAIAISGGKVEAFVSVQSSFNIEVEKEKVSSALKKLTTETSKLSEKLDNQSFRNKAPKKVIEKFEADHQDLMMQLNKQKVRVKEERKIWMLF